MGWGERDGARWAAGCPGSEASTHHLLSVRKGQRLGAELKLALQCLPQPYQAPGLPHAARTEEPLQAGGGARGRGGVAPGNSQACEDRWGD